MTKDKTPSYSVNYATIVMVLIALKIFNQITWPWYVVLAPIWCIIIYMILVVLGTIFFTVWKTLQNYEYKGENSNK